MENDNSNKNKYSDKSQTMFMIGIALIVVGIVLFYIGYSQPKVYSNTSGTEQETSQTVNTNDYVSSTIYYDSNSESEVRQVTYPVNINTASYEELIKIKGIGENKANLIINYRNEVGKFNSIYDLTNIKGFGEATVEKLADYITV